MPECYIVVGEDPPEDMHSKPDHAPGGWQFGAYSDLQPGPIGMGSVAATEEAGQEQVDVVLTMDPAGGCSVRARVWHKRAQWNGEHDEIPQVRPYFTDADGLDQLRISAYGAWGRRGLAAALSRILWRSSRSLILATTNCSCFPDRTSDRPTSDRPHSDRALTTVYTRWDTASSMCP